MTATSPGGEFIDRLIFPGGEVPHSSRVLYEGAGTGLELSTSRICARITRPTLLHWARRIEAERGEAIKAAGRQRYRIWRMYMPAMAYAFDHG